MLSSLKQDNITRNLSLDNKLEYSRGVTEPANTPVANVQKTLITDRKAVASTLKDLGVSDVDDFQDLLTKVIQRQVDNGLPKDKYGNEHAILFVSDRDNSTAYGHDYLSAVLKEGGFCKK